MMADITFNGMTMEFSVVEAMMDAELKETVASTLETYSEQSLLDAYRAAHREKFGKEFLQG
jgi:hypothetical protein